jgi:hypothetical protein
LRETGEKCEIQKITKEPTRREERKLKMLDRY